MTTWFTSDLHLGHANVLGYSSRPFDSIEAHDAALIAEWQAKVKESDDVYLLGDFALCRTETALSHLARLPGKKHFVWGNHDRRMRTNKKFLELLVEHGDILEARVSDHDAPDGVRYILLCHYPMEVWDRAHYGTWHLHGHCHGLQPDNANKMRLDVGVDAWSYKLVSYAEVKERMLAWKEKT